ncbi:Mobile element protein [Candidatus Desulforudis audaxviator]|nr:Mobile element protein [Candidatus Desulforudis audaxviator]AZK59186.1 Mobile element protein [Candidatus Desulforudis audaxviator]AZK60764.2 Mobile element protein [Candidatus Desulforudis audaxviator]
MENPFCNHQKRTTKEVSLMAIIPQQRLFGWQEIDELGDLERFLLVVNHLPDEQLMQKLERERGKGRDDYPVRAVWNSILAGIVFQHVSVESLRRELCRNGQLRELCGFDPARGEDAVPPSYIYSRILVKLMRHADEVENIFTRLVDEIRVLLPDFGRILAIDSKAVSSLARGKKRDEEEKVQKPDGRRDTDADWGRKTYRGRKKGGTLWEKVVWWFGYKLHLVVDAVYELPVGFAVTKASASDVKEGHILIDRVAKEHPEIVARCEALAADKAFDDIKLNVKLWDEYRIKPVIDIRNTWRDGEETWLVTGKENIVYDYRGTVYCCCPETNKRREMAFGGFEKDRETLKYRCPARHYGVECRGMEQCAATGGIRIPLVEDRRIFTPLARSSYKWKTLYKKRTAVERVNARLDEAYGFEKHFIRGLKKMKLRCGLALMVMLAMAVGRLRQKQGIDLRSLVKAA